jgi:t-SNARE complex subunit (syntaxin)
MLEREEEIRNINKGMHQVNEIYKDLARIVGSQQDHVDTIERKWMMPETMPKVD